MPPSMSGARPRPASRGCCSRSARSLSALAPTRKRIWLRREPWRTTTGRSADRSRRRAGPRSRRELVEGGDAVGDHAREDVEPAGGAFRIGGGGESCRQRQAFEQRHDIDAAGLQHRALRQVDRVQLQVAELGSDLRLGAREEARAHAVGHGAEAQVEAGRLQLVGQERLGQPHMPGLDQGADRLHRQDARFRCRRRFGPRLGLGFGHGALALGSSRR